MFRAALAGGALTALLPPPTLFPAWPDVRSRRSRSGSRERRSSRKERRSSRDRDRGSRRDRSRDRDDRGGGGEDVEIAEANALRAKLGIKPLRQ